MFFHFRVWIPLDFLGKEMVSLRQHQLFRCVLSAESPSSSWVVFEGSLLNRSILQMLVLKTLPVAAAPKLLSIMECCRWFGLSLMSWSVLSIVWPAGQGQWTPPVQGTGEAVPQILGSVFTFTECSRTTSNQNRLDFSKDEGAMATGQQRKRFDFSGTNPSPRH